MKKNQEYQNIFWSGPFCFICEQFLQNQKTSKFAHIKCQKRDFESKIAEIHSLSSNFCILKIEKYIFMFASASLIIVRKVLSGSGLHSSSLIFRCKYLNQKKEMKFKTLVQPWKKMKILSKNTTKNSKKLLKHFFRNPFSWTRRHHRNTQHAHLPGKIIPHDYAAYLNLNISKIIGKWRKICIKIPKSFIFACVFCIS